MQNEYWTRENRLEHERNILYKILLEIHSNAYLADFSVRSHIVDRLSSMRSEPITTTVVKLIEQFLDEVKPPTKEEVDAVNFDEE